MHAEYHGGHCCGIRHIYNFEASPKDRCKYSDMGDALDDDWDDVIVPVEIASKRLSRLIQYLTHHITRDNSGNQVIGNPRNGIIEAVLAQSSNANMQPQQQKNWGATLKRRGFKLVSKAKNSNSGNWIYIYHLIY